MHVGHYVYGLNEPGGVRGYVLAVAAAQRRRGLRVSLLDHAERRETGAPSGEDVRFVAGPADLEQAVRALGIDVIHAHGNLPLGLWDGPQGVPLVRTLHGHSPYCPSGSRFLARSGRPCPRSYSPLGCLWGHVVDRCGSVRPAKLAADYRQRAAEAALLPGVPTMVVSAFLERELVRAGYPPQGIHVLRLPAWDRPAEPPAPPPPGDATFLFLGRLVPAKGVSWLLRAFAAVPPPARLEVAGDGDLAARLAAEASALGLGARVHFHGWVDGARARVLLRRCRALVVPSVWHEPSGTVAVEAAAAGRAVIASGVGGLPECVRQGETGLVVPPGDVGALADAMARLAGDPSVALSLGRAGWVRAGQAHDPDTHLDGLDGAYRLARRPSGLAG